MSRRLTADLLPEVPVQFEFSNSVTTCGNEEVTHEERPNNRQLGIRAFPSCIDDKALVHTKYLLPDATGSPRFRFYKSNEPNSGVTVYKNCLIESYYPIIECDNSEECDSQKSRLEIQNIKESPNRGSLTIKETTHLQRNTNNKSIDSRTFTIYSYKTGSTPCHRIDNLRAERLVELQETCETISGLECFAQLHKRIEKLEEKLHETLKKSDPKRKKSRSVQKLFHMISSILERNEKTTVPESFESGNSDTENELRNIKKRLSSLEKKLKKETKRTTRGYSQSKTMDSSLLKGNTNNETFTENRIVLKESDYTEPLYSDTDSHVRKERLSKNKVKSAEDKAKRQVEKRVLSKCKILKRKNNLNAKFYIAPSEHQNPEIDKKGQSCENECLSAVPVSSTHSITYHIKNLEPESKIKYRKRNRAKSRKLCKKNSKTNIVTRENRNKKRTSTKHKWVTHQRQNCWVPCACAGCPYRDLSASLPFLSDGTAVSFPPFREDPEILDLDKKPLNFFKCDSNEKTPILFEEIVATPKPLRENNDTSKLTIRSVLSQRKKDALTTLRNFVKKLSQTQTDEDKTNKFLKVVLER